VRVRILGEAAFLTVKGRKEGLTCPEFEYAIPVAEAQAMLAGVCLRPFIEKVRYRLDVNGVVWEIDEFTGENRGLIVAEVELEDENMTIERPPWVGREVSCDPEYWNMNLMSHPYCRWPCRMKTEDAKGDEYV
jgi:CYTH domain-containing protein